MHLKIVFYIFILLLLGCNQNQQEINSNILSKDKMVLIITELEMSQATFKIEKPEKKFDLEDLTSKIFQNHQTTKQQFDESMAFYAHNQQDLEAIYNEVIVLISSSQAKK